MECTHFLSQLYLYNFDFLILIFMRAFFLWLIFPMLCFSQSKLDEAKSLYEKKQFSKLKVMRVIIVTKL